MERLVRMSRRAAGAGIPCRALLALAALALAAAAQAGGAPSKPEGVRGGRILALLTNGTGDGTATVRVGPYGEFGSLLGASLVYNPVGPAAAASTTYFSSIWFSGVNRAGQGGRGFFLERLPFIPFTATSSTQAVSQWDLQRIHFQLTQTLLPVSATGTSLRQVYTLTNNTGATAAFDLLRHLDGDLQGNFADDFAGVTRGGQTLFEFDSADNPSNPTTFIGIDLGGAANLGYRVAEFQFTDDIFARGRAVLNNTFTADSTPPADDNARDSDTNGDFLTDFAYDVTLTSGQTFSLPAGASITFVTDTLLGQGAPIRLLGAPSNLTATGVSPSEIDLSWQDNTGNETGFAIERRSAETGFIQIARVGPNETTYQNRNLPAASTWTYRVRALFADGTASPYSNEVTASTLGVQNRPPSNLTATLAAPRQITLAWTDNSAEETGFAIERRTADEPFTQIDTTPRNVRTYQDRNLPFDTTFTYRVRALFAGGTFSVPSNEASATTGPVPNEAPLFVAPTPADGATLRVRAGTPVSFTVTARDADVDVDLVTLTVAGLPPTAVQAPPLPATGNPVSSTFSWTPASGEEGIYAVTYTATDRRGATATTTVRLLFNRIGVCTDGTVVIGTGGLRFNGDSGWPGPSNRLTGHLKVRHRSGGPTLVSTSITGLTVVGNTATLAGTCRINGRRGHTFRMVVQDNGPTPRDRLQELTVDGTAWGAGPLRSGEIKFHRP